MKLDEETRKLFVGAERDPKAEALLRALDTREAKSVFARFVAQLGDHPSADAVLAAIATTLAWGPLMRKRITRLTAECLPWWIKLFGAMIGAAVPAPAHEATRFCGIDNQDILGRRSLTEVAFVALLGKAPNPADLFAFQTRDDRELQTVGTMFGKGFAENLRLSRLPRFKARYLNLVTGKQALVDLRSFREVL